MSDKLHPLLQQEEQLEIASLQCSEVLRAHHGIQVPRLNP